MMDILLSLFFFMASIVGFATSATILFFSKGNYSKNFFLGLFLFSLAVVSIYNFYLAARIFKNFPDLFMVTKAFIFLAAPCAFLYIRDILFPNSQYKKYDWFHFMPFVVYFTLTVIVWIGNFTDIIFIDYLSARIKSPFSMLSICLWLIYAFCQTMMLLNYDLEKFKSIHESSKFLFWIRIYTLMILFLFSCLFVHSILTNNSVPIDYSCYIIISSALFFTAAILYFNPQFRLSGNYSDEFINSTDKPLEFKVNHEKKTQSVKRINSEKKEKYLAQLEEAFITKEIFLKKNLTIKDLSDETSISLNELSHLINSEFNVHFQDYVNLKRIEYFKQKCNDTDWKDLSLEGMSWACGFKSRTTFFRAFIKHTGKSPSEYFKENQPIVKIINQLN